MAIISHLIINLYYNYYDDYYYKQSSPFEKNPNPNHSAIQFRYLACALSVDEAILFGGCRETHF